MISSLNSALKSGNSINENDNPVSSQSNIAQSRRVSFYSNSAISESDPFPQTIPHPNGSRKSSLKSILSVASEDIITPPDSPKNYNKIETPNSTSVNVFSPTANISIRHVELEPLKNESQAIYAESFVIGDIIEENFTAASAETRKNKQLYSHNFLKINSIVSLESDRADDSTVDNFFASINHDISSAKSKLERVDSPVVIETVSAFQFSKNHEASDAETNLISPSRNVEVFQIDYSNNYDASIEFSENQFVSPVNIEDKYEQRIVKSEISAVNSPVVNVISPVEEIETKVAMEDTNLVSDFETITNYVNIALPKNQMMSPTNFEDNYQQNSAKSEISDTYSPVVNVISPAEVIETKIAMENTNIVSDFETITNYVTEALPENQLMSPTNFEDNYQQYSAKSEISTINSPVVNVMSPVEEIETKVAMEDTNLVSDFETVTNCVNIALPKNQLMSPTNFEDNYQQNSAKSEISDTYSPVVNVISPAEVIETKVAMEDTNLVSDFETITNYVTEALPENQLMTPTNFEDNYKQNSAKAEIFGTTTTPGEETELVPSFESPINDDTTKSHISNNVLPIESLILSNDESSNEHNASIIYLEIENLSSKDDFLENSEIVGVKPDIDGEFSSISNTIVLVNHDIVSTMSSLEEVVSSSPVASVKRFLSSSQDSDSQ
ncbi:hypothetical protein HK096_007210, partial [Nowakowskiella sp. JEL0078]